MLFTCTPPEWNEPEILKIYNAKYSSIEFLQYPGATSLPWICFNFWRIDGGKVSFRYNLSPFTAHCGIKSVTGLGIWPPVGDKILTPKISRLFLRTVEAFAYECELSLLIASDGPDGPVDTFLRTHGEGWVNNQPGVNRRMGKNHIMNLWWKYLNKDDHSWINWNYKGLLPKDAQPTAG